MKRAVMFLSVISSLLVSTGCLHHNRYCNSCNGPIGCRPCRIGWQRGGTDYQASLSHSEYRQGGGAYAAGPAAAQVAYPYYTTRGPRDFLLNNPPTIGN